MISKKSPIPQSMTAINLAGLKTELTELRAFCVKGAEKGGADPQATLSYLDSSGPATKFEATVLKRVIKKKGRNSSASIKDTRW